MDTQLIFIVSVGVNLLSSVVLLSLSFLSIVLLMVDKGKIKTAFFVLSMLMKDALLVSAVVSTIGALVLKLPSLWWSAVFGFLCSLVIFVLICLPESRSS